MLADLNLSGPAAREFENRRAYNRAIELMDAFEEIAKEQLGGRLAATYGIWKQPRDVIEAELKLHLYGSPLYGLQLDRVLRDYFDSVCNVKLKPPEIVHPARDTRRQRFDMADVPDEPIEPYYNEASHRNETGEGDPIYPMPATAARI